MSLRETWGEKVSDIGQYFDILSAIRQHLFNNQHVLVIDSAFCNPSMLELFITQLFKEESQQDRSQVETCDGWWSIVPVLMDTVFVEESLNKDSVAIIVPPVVIPGLATALPISPCYHANMNRMKMLNPEEANTMLNYRLT